MNNKLTALSTDNRRRLVVMNSLWLDHNMRDGDIEVLDDRTDKCTDAVRLAVKEYVVEKIGFMMCPPFGEQDAENTRCMFSGLADKYLDLHVYIFSKSHEQSPLDYCPHYSVTLEVWSVIEDTLKRDVLYCDGSIMSKYVNLLLQDDLGTEDWIKAWDDMAANFAAQYKLNNSKGDTK